MLNQVFNYSDPFLQKVTKRLKSLEIFNSLSEINLFKLAFKFKAQKYK